MKRGTIGFCALALGAFAATGVLADGLPGGGSLKDAPAASTCGTSTYNWNGAYAGVQLGGSNFRSTVAMKDILGISTQREDTGFTIGGVVGYNLQRCNTVFGLEAELNWTDNEKDWGINLGNLAGLGGGGLGGSANIFSAKSTMDLYGAIKLRSGLALDNMLLYLTGGVAFADIKHSGSNTGLLGLPPGVLAFNTSDTRWGWVVGAGTEYAITNRITWRSEATYTRFEDKNFGLNLNAGGFGGPSGTLLGLNAMDEVWRVMTGINFKF